MKTRINESNVSIMHFIFYNKLFNNLFGRNFNMRQQHHYHGKQHNHDGKQHNHIGQQHNHIGQLIDCGMGGNWRHTADYRLHAAAERNL